MTKGDMRWEWWKTLWKHPLEWTRRGVSLKPGEFRPWILMLTLFFRFEIKKLPGNFHLSTHSVDVQPDEYDFGHIIHEVNNHKQIFYFMQRLQPAQNFWVIFVLYSRLLADFLSHLEKWVKLIKFEAENEFFLHWKVKKPQCTTSTP